MKSTFNRREFIKLAGAGVAASLLSSLDLLPEFPMMSGLQPPGGPSRFHGPFLQPVRGSGVLQPVRWDRAIGVVADTFQRYAPHEIAFLLGLYPDHLNHIVQLIARALGGASVLRYDPQAEYDGRVTLLDAAQRLFGLSQPPIFDPAGLDLVFSFGALPSSLLDHSDNRNVGQALSLTGQTERRRSLPQSKSSPYLVQFEAGQTERRRS